MSDLSRLIREFHAKYPPDARMEWKGKPPAIDSDVDALQCMARDLTTASARHRKEEEK